MADDNFCLGGANQPHKIESLRVEEGVDPISKQLVGAFKVICVKCGKTLEQIANPVLKVRRSRKPKSAVAPAEAPAPGSEVDPKSLDS